MAHWAEIDENNMVIQVVVGDNNDPNGDEGYQWLIDNLGGTWLKASYTSRAGNRIDPNTGEVSLPGKHFRKNYPSIGFFYDETRDAFIPPKPYNSWILNEDSCLWEAPVPYPDINLPYDWDEETQSWILLD